MADMAGGEWLGACGVPTAPSSPEQRMALAGMGAETSTLTGGGESSLARSAQDMVTGWGEHRSRRRDD